jgi:serine/threonine protein kinase
VKVADLGIMKQLTLHKPGVLPRTNTFVGTASYMSPERIDGKEYSFSADIWAFGLSLVTLAQGKLPIDTQGGYWAILHGIRDAASPSLPDSFSSEFRDFVTRCLKKRPEERATCAELLKHPFLNKAVPDDLTYDQSEARSVKELLSILHVLVTHIQALKADYSLKYVSADAYLAESSPGHDRMFGNVYQDTVKDIVERILLPEDGGPAAEAERRRRRKPRLGSLARQLHMPLDRVVSEARAFISSLPS